MYKDNIQIVGVVNISKSNTSNFKNNISNFIKNIFFIIQKNLNFKGDPDNDPYYVKERLAKFIKFFDDEKERNRDRERLIQFLIIIIGATIYSLNKFGYGKSYIKRKFCNLRCFNSNANCISSI